MNRILLSCYMFRNSSFSTIQLSHLSKKRAQRCTSCSFLTPQSRASSMRELEGYCLYMCPVTADGDMLYKLLCYRLLMSMPSFHAIYNLIFQWHSRCSQTLANPSLSLHHGHSHRWDPSLAGAEMTRKMPWTAFLAGAAASSC